MLNPSGPMSDTAAYAVGSPAADSVGNAAGQVIYPTSRPTILRIPTEARPPRPESVPAHAASWSQMAASDVLNEDGASLVGVSIGREQTRLNSPTTPAVEKSAALDRNNNYGFFDGTLDDVQQLADIEEDNRVAEARISDVGDLGLPSPWLAGPQLHVDTNKVKNRSRASSVFNGSIPTLPSLPDLNVRQMWQNFNPPSFADALQKLAPTNPLKDAPSLSKRPSRSNSLFANRVSWNSAIRKDGSTSPRRLTASAQHSGNATPTSGSALSRGLPGSPKSVSPERALPPRAIVADMITDEPESEGDSTPEAVTPILPSVFPAVKVNESATASFPQSKPPRPQLRRSVSETSIISKVSTYSFEENGQDFSHIDSMVNSRFKAVTDSWQDSAFRHHAKRLSFKPDFLRGSEDGSSMPSRALSSIFGDEQSRQSSRTRSATPPGRPQSPSKISRHPSLDTAIGQIEGDLVILGGYRGSVLRSAEDRRQLWVPFKVGLHMRKVNLEVGLDPEDEETEHERIYASGILSHIGPIDISRRLIRRINNTDAVRSGKLRFHDYGYDWRLSPELLGRQLIRYLEKLKCNQPDTPPAQRGATIIAHSLGGLITRWAVNERPDLFAGVLYAGTPQHCINILGPIRNGDDVLLSSKVLTAQVNFTLRTSYALLPENGRCFIDIKTKEEYPVNFFDVRDWEQYRFSPVVAPTLPAVSDPRLDRRSGLLNRLRESTPSLLSQSSSNLSDDSTKSGETTIKTNTNVNSSSARAAADTADRKAADLVHPHQNTMNLSMPQAPVPGPSTTVTIPRDRALAYLRRTLTDTLRFKQNLAHRKSHQQENRYPPHAVLYATCVPTVYGAQVNGRDGIGRADAYDNLAFAAGDGVVLARASMLPKGYHVAPGGRVLTDRGHVGLLGDLESVGKCLLAIVVERRNGVGTGAHQASPTSNNETKTRTR